MTINLTKLTYELDSEGNTTDVVTNLTGNDDAGQYISAQIKIVSADLATGKTFDDLTKADITTIAKNKLQTETKA